MSNNMSLYEYQNDPSDVDVSDFLNHLEILENKRKREDEVRARRLEAELSRMKTMSKSINRQSTRSKYRKDDEYLDGFDSDQENKYGYDYGKSSNFDHGKDLHDRYDNRGFLNNHRSSQTSLSSKSRNYSPKRSSTMKKESFNDEIDVYYDDNDGYDSRSIYHDNIQDGYDSRAAYHDKINDGYGSRSAYHYPNDLDEEEEEEEEEEQKQQQQEQAFMESRTRSQRYQDQSLHKKLSTRAKKYLENDEIDDLDDEDIDDIIRLISPIARKLSKAKAYSKSEPSSPLKGKSSRKSRNHGSPRSSRGARALPSLPTINGSDDSFEYTEKPSTRERYSQSPRSSHKRQPNHPFAPPSKKPIRKHAYDRNLSDDDDNGDDLLMYKSAYNYEKSLDSKPIITEVESDEESILDSIKYSSSASSYKSRTTGSSPIKANLDFEFSKPMRTSTMKRSTIFDNLDDVQETSAEEETRKSFSPSLFDLKEIDDEPEIFSLSQPNSLAAKIKQHSDKKQYLSKKSDAMSRSLPSSTDAFRPAPNISDSTMTLLRKLSKRQSNFESSVNGKSNTIAEQFDVSKYDKNDDLHNLSSFLRSRSIRGKQGNSSPTKMKPAQNQIIEEEEEDEEEAYDEKEQGEESDKDNDDTTTIHTSPTSLRASPQKNKMLERLMSLSETPKKPSPSPSPSPVNSPATKTPKFAEPRTSRFDSPSTSSPIRGRSSSPVRDLINKHNGTLSTTENITPVKVNRSGNFSSPKSISSLASKFENKQDDSTPTIKASKEVATFSSPTSGRKSNIPSPFKENNSTPTKMKTMNKVANRYNPMPKSEDAVSAGLAAKSAPLTRKQSRFQQRNTSSNRYIPVPDSVAAISAALAAKAPKLNTEVSKTVGERDFSLSDNAKFIKPSIEKSRVESRFAKNLDIEKEINLKSDHKLKIKVKENHWLGSAIQRSPTKNKQDLIDLINEKPKFYQSIENSKRLNEGNAAIMEEEEEEDVDYTNIPLKKVSQVESPLKKDNIFDEIPDFVKLRNKQAAASSRIQQELKSKVDEITESDKLLEMRSKLNSSNERKNALQSTKTFADMPTDSLEIIKKIRSRSPERISQIEKGKSSKFNELPDDASEIINKIRSKSPERINQFEKGRAPTFKAMPEDAEEVIRKIRSKSPQRITEFERAKKNRFDNMPEDALEVIKKIRKQG